MINTTKKILFKTLAASLALGIATVNSFAVSAIPEWKQSVVYDYGDEVNYNGYIYEAKWWTQGSTPSEEDNYQNPWKLKEVSLDDFENSSPENTKVYTEDGIYTYYTFDSSNINVLPIYSSFEEGVSAGATEFVIKASVTETLPSSPKNLLRSSPASDGYSVSTLKSTLTQNDYVFGVHPAFKNQVIDKNASSISITAKNETFSFTVDFGIGPVTAPYEPAGSSGSVSYKNPFYHNSNSNVMLRGTLITYTYEVKKYSPTGALMSTSQVKSQIAKNSKVVFKGLEGSYKDKILTP